MAADLAELKAQQAEALAWRELTLAQLAATRAVEVEMKFIEEFREKKSALDAARSKLAKAGGEANIARAQLTRLKPAFEVIVRP